jgi:Cu(I)/Ag(I) efflux system membrane protein CusA/SilA
MAYIVRGLGYIKNIKDVEEIAITIICPELRYRFCSNGWGFTSRDFDANGEGEVVGGIGDASRGENADKVIDAVKQKMKEVEKIV